MREKHANSRKMLESALTRFLREVSQPQAAWTCMAPIHHLCGWTHISVTGLIYLPVAVFVRTAVLRFKGILVHQHTILPLTRGCVDSKGGVTMTHTHRTHCSYRDPCCGLHISIPHPEKSAGETVRTDSIEKGRGRAVMPGT